MKKIRTALIGVGSISQRGILPHLLQDDAREVSELIAVCDINEERVKAVADEYDLEYAFTSYQDVLAIDDLDAVLLTTPIGIHFEQARDAILCGKHVYIQKTMTTTSAEANELIDLAKNEDVIIVASPGQMLSPVVQKIKSEIEKGTFGPIYWAFANTAFMGHEYEPIRADNPIDPTWYYKKPGGGPVYDMSVYALHTITGVLGPAKRVFSMSGIRMLKREWKDTVTDVDMDDNTLLMLDFGDNCFAVVGGQFCQFGSVMGWGFTGFYGASGSVEITDFLPNTTYPSKLKTNPDELISTFPNLNQDELIKNLPYSFKNHSKIQEAHAWTDIRHFFDCIVNKKAPIPSPEHARHVIEIIEKGYLAAKTGQVQLLETIF